jgi:IS30 family transposase
MIPKVSYTPSHNTNWQRPTNENTNGLLRQYFPKEVDLSGYSQRHLTQVAEGLNNRPRKSLGFRTPAEVMVRKIRELNAGVLHVKIETAIFARWR